MYSSKKDKFNTDLLKAELAKAKELGQAIKVDELTAFDQANIEFVNQYKDAVEVAAFKDQTLVFYQRTMHHDLAKSHMHNLRNMWLLHHHHKRNESSLL